MKCLLSCSILQKIISLNSSSSPSSSSMDSSACPIIKNPSAADSKHFFCISLYASGLVTSISSTCVYMGIVLLWPVIKSIPLSWKIYPVVSRNPSASIKLLDSIKIRIAQFHSSLIYFFNILTFYIYLKYQVWRNLFL